MNTDSIKEVVKARYNHRVNKLTLQEKYVAQLEIVANGGVFSVNPHFISYLSSQTEDELIVLDNNLNPTKIDRIEMLDKTRQIYNRVMTEWYAESEESKRQR